MPTTISFSINIDLSGIIVAEVDERRGQIRPTTVKHPAVLANILYRIAGKVIHGYEMMGKEGDVTIRLPVDLWYLATSTCYRTDDCLSVLQVVAQHLRIPPERIVPEYPPNDRAQEVISRLCDERDRAQIWAMQKAQAKIARWLRDQAGACVSAERVDALTEAAKCIERGAAR